MYCIEIPRRVVPSGSPKPQISLLERVVGAERVRERSSDVPHVRLTRRRNVFAENPERVVVRPSRHFQRSSLNRKRLGEQRWRNDSGRHWRREGTRKDGVLSKHRPLEAYSRTPQIVLMPRD